MGLCVVSNLSYRFKAQFLFSLTVARFFFPTIFPSLMNAQNRQLGNINISPENYSTAFKGHIQKLAANAVKPNQCVHSVPFI